MEELPDHCEDVDPQMFATTAVKDAVLRAVLTSLGVILTRCARVATSTERSATDKTKGLVASRREQELISLH